MKVINFGDKKEQFERAKHGVKLAVDSKLDSMEKRRVILKHLQAHARDTAAKFHLTAYDEKERYTTEFVTSVFISVDGATLLFADIEIDLIKKAYLGTLEAEQYWAGLLSQEWKV